MALSVNITKKLPEFKLDVKFEAQENTLGILGASGSGKSMTLRCIAGLDRPDQGQIVLGDKVLFDTDRGINLPARARNVGFLFQNYALFPHLTVYENIAFGLRGSLKRDINRKVMEKIDMVQLRGLEQRRPHQLSGGQQQRVALARALIVEPEVLLFDEPFSALDNHLRGQMERELLEALTDYTGATLFVTHDLDECYRVCDDLIILDSGKKIAAGPKDALFLSPPNHKAARLTGCKNLSRAKRSSANTIEALDWAGYLQVNQPIPEDLTHVGIRAHHIEFVGTQDQINTFPCRLIGLTESPHRISLYLKLVGSPKSDAVDNLQVELYKEAWYALKDKPEPWFVHLDSHRLFLMNEV